MDDVVETVLTEILVELLGLEAVVGDQEVYVHPEGGLDRGIVEGGDDLPPVTSCRAAGEEEVVPSCPSVVVVALHPASLEEVPLANHEGVVQKWVVLQDPSLVFVLHLSVGHLQKSCVDHVHLLEVLHPVSCTHTDFLAHVVECESLLRMKVFC